MFASTKSREGRKDRVQRLEVNTDPCCTVMRTAQNPADLARRSSREGNRRNRSEVLFDRLGPMDSESLCVVNAQVTQRSEDRVVLGMFRDRLFVEDMRNIRDRSDDCGG